MPDDKIDIIVEIIRKGALLAANNPMLLPLPIARYLAKSVFEKFNEFHTRNGAPPPLDLTDEDTINNCSAMIISLIGIGYHAALYETALDAGNPCARKENLN